MNFLISVESDLPSEN